MGRRGTAVKEFIWLINIWDRLVAFVMEVLSAVMIHTARLLTAVLLAWEKLSTTLRLWHVLMKGFKISLFFAWYDAWVGMFYDRKKKVLYVCPLPCCVLKIERRPSPPTVPTSRLPGRFSKRLV
jgi:hypothetical protein